MLRSILLSSCFSVAIALSAIAPVTAEESIIISHLMVRNGTLIVSQNSKGKIEYSLIDSEGNNVVKNVSEAQLIAQYPDLYDLVRSGVATDSESSPWAGMLDY